MASLPQWAEKSGFGESKGTINQSERNQNRSCSLTLYHRENNESAQLNETVNVGDVRTKGRIAKCSNTRHTKGQTTVTCGGQEQTTMANG